MSQAATINLFQFLIIYFLLLIVFFVLKRSKINQTKLLFVASLRMTVQLILVGMILQWLFAFPYPLFTIVFISTMIGISIKRITSTVKGLNTRFKWIVGLSLSGSGLFVLVFFVTLVLGESIFNPQYTIPLAGMIIGNAMTGITIGLKSFMEALKKDTSKLNTLLNLGVHPKDILKPLAHQALETALIPTLNSMLGMGIIFLPGMMTGQILSGTLPTTAILYQIAIMIAICTSVCLTVYFSLHLGYHTLYTQSCQFNLPSH